MGMLQVSIPDELREKLRRYCFENKVRQNDFVFKAIMLNFDKLEKEKTLCQS